MKRLFIFCCFALSIGLAVSRNGRAAAPIAELPPALRMPPLLTLDAALELFLSQGLDLLIANANVESARADVRLAGAVVNPTLSGSFMKSFNYDPHDPAACPSGSGCSDLGFVIGLTDQALWDVATGKRGLRLKTSQAALSAAQLGRADAERTLTLQVKQQFVQVALAQAALDFTTEVVESAGQTADLNRRRYQAGAISEVDLSKAETDSLEAQQAFDSARAHLREQQVGLAFLLGARGPIPEFKVKFDLTQREMGMIEAAQSPGLLIEAALHNRPDLKAQAAQLERAQSALQAAYRQRVPDGALNIQYQQQGSGQTAIQPPTLTVGLQIALPILNQNQGGIDKGRADVRLQTAQYAKLQSQVVSDVELSGTALDRNRRLIERLETGLLDRATRTRDLQRLRYQKGAASLLEYLDAQRVYITSYQEYFQALANYWSARYQLEYAVANRR